MTAWIVIGVLAAVAVLTMPKVPGWVYHWRHAAHVTTLTETEPVTVPEYGSMILTEERPDWVPRNELVLPDQGGWISGPMLDVPDSEDWTEELLAELHGAPTVLDEPPVPPGRFQSRQGTGNGAAVAHPPTAAAPPGAVDGRVGYDPEGHGLTDPTAPGSRLLRTTGEIMRADLLADVCAFMARQDAEAAVWMATFCERWAAA